MISKNIQKRFIYLYSSWPHQLDSGKQRHSGHSQKKLAKIAFKVLYALHVALQVACRLFRNDMKPVNESCGIIFFNPSKKNGQRRAAWESPRQAPVFVLNIYTRYINSLRKPVTELKSSHA